MSYCRWSTDDFKSDVYVYEDVCGGWTTHVRSKRPVRPVPPMPDSAVMDSKKFNTAYTRWALVYQSIPKEKIGLKYDGRDFNDDSLNHLLERLIMLQEAGYHIPQCAFDEIEEEMQEGVGLDGCSVQRAQGAVS